MTNYQTPEEISGMQEGARKQRRALGMQIDNRLESAKQVLLEITRKNSQIISEISEALKKVLPKSLVIKDEPEIKLDMEFCQRCDIKTNQGRWLNDEFYCESCVGYYESRAESIVDLQVDYARENE